MRDRANIFSIPPGCNFLKVFVRSLQQGEILPDLDWQDLSRLEILVPTKRAARSLKAQFLAQANRAMILPNIISLNAIDQFSLYAMLSDAERQKASQPTIGALERILLLAQMVKKWQLNMSEAAEFSAANSIWLAHELAGLIDEAALYNIDWRKLEKLGQELGASLSEWWLLSYDFLQIVTQYWPQMLCEREKLDIGQARWLRFHHKAQLVKQSEHPIIALGSSGAVPCVAMLLEAIAFSKNGAVILPGVDRDLSEATWQSFANYQQDTILYSQPQFHYYKLLRKLQMARVEIKHLGQTEPQIRAREFYVAKALMPANAAQEWASLPRESLESAFQQVALVEALSEREEAAAIAIALRLAVQDKDKIAAFVTADRNLARRVSIELARFGIRANDSGQQPLLSLPSMQLMQLILQACVSDDVNVLLSLLKHPLTRLNYEHGELRDLVELYEIYRLRGAVLRFSLLDLARLESQMYDQWLDQASDKNINYSEELQQRLQQLVERISLAIEPLRELFASSAVSLTKAAEALIRCFENFGRAADGSIVHLYEGSNGQGIINFFQEIADNTVEYSLKASEFEQVFTALAANINVEPSPAQSNVYIWGILEARLQHADLMVIGGLNEGSLPKIPSSSPFISRLMKIKLGLEPPEIAIGAAALDLQMLLGVRQLVLSRSLNMEGEAQVASRWLQRVQTILGPQISSQLIERGNEYLQLARAIETAPPIVAAQRPAPKPPLSLRPRHFSITDIAKLQRDPYSIYASKILQLHPLRPLVRDAAYREKGLLYHEILAKYIGERASPDQLAAIASQEFAALSLPPDIELMWRCIFDKTAENYLEFEQKREVLHSYIEHESRPVALGSKGASLHGRADRIDIRRSGDGSLVADIIDYKTVSLPLKKSVESLENMQLLLEAALLLRGGFGLDYKCSLGQLIYVRLHQKEFEARDAVQSSKEGFLSELVERAWQYCGELVDSYYNVDQAYIAYKSMLKANEKARSDFHHLCRYEEWAR